MREARSLADACGARIADRCHDATHTQSKKAQALRARGVEVVRANFDDINSLKAAFQGACGQKKRTSPPHRNRCFRRSMQFKHCVRRRLLMIFGSGECCGDHRC